MNTSKNSFLLLSFSLSSFPPPSFLRPFIFVLQIKDLNLATLAQLAARQSHNLKVVSSILTCRNIFCFKQDPALLFINSQI